MKCPECVKVSPGVCRECSDRFALEFEEAIKVREVQHQVHAAKVTKKFNDQNRE